VSFFKKNKSKTKKPAITDKPDQTALEKEIAKMDQDRHLDLQLEELSAQLNIKPDSHEVDETDLNTPSEDLPNTPAEAAKSSLGGAGFLTNSLQDFVSPSFSATLADKTKSIDVTEPEAIEPKTNEYDELLAAAQETAKEEARTEARLAAAKTPAAPLEAPQIETAPSTDLPNVETDLSFSGPSRLDMGAMRLDVAKISADIQSGEEVYRRALQRVEGLMSFVEKAEVDFSILNRLEPENRRLKAKLRTSQGEVETIKGKLSLTESELQDHQERLAEKTSQYEQARGKLITAANSLQEYERVLKVTKTEAERYALAIERHKTALGVEGRENKVLREKIGELSRALETRQAEYLNASKAVESLRSDCEDFRDQADTFRAEAQDLRIALNTAKRQNNAMKGEMKALHEDIKTFKTQYEFNVINREDQVTDLESQVAFLAKEVDLKTELANTATQDIASLRSIRNEQDIERDRLEKKLSAAHEEIKDITTLSEARNSEKLNALQAELQELKAEILRRDEAFQQKSKETADLQRNHKAVEMERERLQSRLDLQTQQLDSAIKNNPTAHLETQIKNLTEQLQIKDDIVRSAAQDVSTLRKEREGQIAEQKRLEDLIHSQTFQLETAHKALAESKQTETELDQKYKNIAAALSVNQSRRRSENPTEQPDISDEFEDLSGDDVEDRIMDYKFGIRKDIV